MPNLSPNLAPHEIIRELHREAVRRNLLDADCDADAPAHADIESEDPASPVDHTADRRQQKVAVELGLSESQMSRIMRTGKHAGPWVQLTLVAYYCTKLSLKPQVGTLFFLSWLMHEAWEWRKKLEPSKKKPVPEAVESRRVQLFDHAVDEIGHFVRESLLPSIIRGTSGPEMSLQNFSDFLSMTVVCGDRRFEEAAGLGDLLAMSPSITDLQFVSGLRLPSTARFVSDKPFVEWKRDKLERTFGKTHLLLVGSPLVNLATRYMQGDAPFRFKLSPEAVKYALHVRDDLRELSTAELQLLNRLLGLSAGEQRRRVAELTAGARGRVDGDRVLRAAGLFEGKSEKELTELFVEKEYATDLKIRQPYVSKHEEGVDTGVITIGKNPLAREGDNYFCVIVAGYGAAGTSVGLRVLADPKEFEGRPRGGVLQYTDLKNYERSSWSWVTEKHPGLNGNGSVARTASRL